MKVPRGLRGVRHHNQYWISEHCTCDGSKRVYDFKRWDQYVCEEMGSQDKENQWSNSRNPAAHWGKSEYEYLSWLKQTLNVRKERIGSERVDWVSTTKKLPARPKNTCLISLNNRM